MSELSLAAQSPLGGVELETGGVKIAEITGRAIVSITTPKGGGPTLDTAMASAFKCKLPAAGQSTRSPVAGSQFLWMQSDQIFVLFDHDGPDPVAEVAKRLKGAAYLTDQSDAWAMIAVRGKNSRLALERICPVDLHGAVFLQGAVARTMMEHMAAIILCEGRQEFVLMSPRSSSKSFFHALEISARNIS
ncbi:hypothetical protein MNBD_ALPHA09-1782 [hydrothermal vent metagenome]|uniref:Sarcosine oxidase gamma subunit n=1 Tax=hydrothermal vent metagenome TaxID=652676 RepID=A0A3B0T7X5_9ZZZZ